MKCNREETDTRTAPPARPDVAYAGRRCSRRACLLGGAALALRPAMWAAAPPEVDFAFGTYGMKSLSVAEALDEVASIGYDAVELCLLPGWPSDPERLGAEGRRELKRRLAASGLRLPAVLDSLVLIGTPEKRASNLRRVRLAAELAAALAGKTPVVLDTVLGLRPQDWEPARGRMVEELREWVRAAGDGNLVIAVKPHAAQSLNNAAKTLWLLREVASPRLRTVYDYSHFHVEGFALEASLTELFPHVALISMKDSEGVPPKHRYLLPGEGKTDYVEYFRLLKRLGYSGSVGVEVSAMIHSRPGYDPRATARLCYQRLAPAFEKAGLARRKRRG